MRHDRSDISRVGVQRATLHARGAGVGFYRVVGAETDGDEDGWGGIVEGEDMGKKRDSVGGVIARVPAEHDVGVAAVAVRERRAETTVAERLLGDGIAEEDDARAVPGDVVVAAGWKRRGENGGRGIVRNPANGRSFGWATAPGARRAARGFGGGARARDERVCGWEASAYLLMTASGGTSPSFWTCLVALRACSCRRRHGLQWLRYPHRDSLPGTLDLTVYFCGGLSQLPPVGLLSPPEHPLHPSQRQKTSMNPRSRLLRARVGK